MCLDIACVCSVRSTLQERIQSGTRYTNVLSFVCGDIKHISFSDHPGV